MKANRNIIIRPLMTEKISMLQETENKVAMSLLRWKYKREGKRLPRERDMERRSREITDRANEVISRSGRNIWKEIKKAYQKGVEKEDSHR